MDFQRFAVGGGTTELCQNIATGCIKEGHHGRMFEPSLNCDGIEFLLDGIETSCHLRSILAADFLFHNGQPWEQPMAFLAEGF